MDKEAVKVEELIKDLRGYYKALESCGDENCWLGKMVKKAADALEQYHRSGKFHTFVWETLGHTTMRQLIDMYREEQEEKADD